MKKILVLIAALISFNLFGLPLYEDSSEKLDAVIKQLDANPDNASCAPLLFNLCSFNYLMGTDELIKYLKAFTLKTKNPALYSIAFGLKDEIEILSAKKEKSDYVKSKSVLMSWKLSTQSEFGYNDLYFPSAETGPMKNIMISSAEGYFISDNYLHSFSGTAVLDSSVSVGSDGILMVDSNAEYVVYSDGKKVIDNTGSLRKTMRLIAVSKGRSDIKIKLNLFQADSSYQSSKMRVVLLDKKFRPIAQTSVKGKGKLSDMDDPALAELIKQKKYFETAEYLSNLGSMLAGDYYKKALSSGINCRYQYASWVYLKYGNGEMLASLTGITETPDREERVFLMKKMVSEERFFEALAECKKLISEKRTYDCEKNYIWILYKLSLNKMFYSEAAEFIKKYPDNTEVIQLILYKDLELKGTCDKDMLHAVLSGGAARGIRKSLYMKYMKEGEYLKALSVVDKYHKQGENDFTLMYVRALIDSGKVSEARKILLKMTALNESYEAYYLLDLMERKSGSGAGMYYSKMLALKPENAALAEYLSYSESSVLVNVFEKYRNRNKIDSEIADFVKNQKQPRHDSLFKGDYILMTEGGKFSVFKEFLVYVRSDSDADEYGEIQLPSGAEIIRARVYHPDGTFNDSYRISNAGRTYITVDGVRPNSLLHVAYRTRVYDYTYFGSKYYSSFMFNIQDYWRSLKYAEVKLINRSREKTVLYNSSLIKIEEAVYPDETILSFAAENIQPRKKENYSGYYSKSLLSYAFWNIRSESDFDKIIAKKNYNKNISLPEGVKDLKSDDEKIKVIYDYINSMIETRGGFDYSLRSYDLMFTSKKADAEDKAYLAADMLKEAGIDAYPAFVRNSFVRNGQFFSERFSAILLYVKRKNAAPMWLDFSNKYYPAGVVSDSHSGETALIFTGNGVDSAVVQSSEDRKTVSQFKIDVKTKKFDYNSFFYGDYVYLRQYFDDERFNEKNVLTLMEAYRADAAFDKLIITKDKFSFSASGIISFKSADAGKDYIIFPFMHNSNASAYARSVERSSPVVISESVNDENVFEYTLPERFISIEFDKVRKYTFGKCSAEFTLNKKKGSPVLKAVQKLYIPKGEISVEDYTKFAEFCANVKTEEKYQLLISADSRK
ncbi:MAG: hypothetical protein KBH06_07935 [Spirochaetes bacterium]|nr:hypothetical protein [Spirochaetota bacterium]